MDSAKLIAVKEVELDTSSQERAQTVSWWVQPRESVIGAGPTSKQWVGSQQLVMSSLPF